jgi:transcriptional regulator with GAF, ATPase, and Fis domain
MLTRLDASTDHLTPIAREIHALSQRRWSDIPPALLIGQSALFVSALERLARLARADSPILLTGETGTGKELFARALYLLSRRNRMPYLNINCAQYQDGQVIASELFGHKKGSFTGAVADHRGIFEAADGGVVFLDEIGELSLTAQAMLLRALSEGEIVPVGEAHARRVNVRIVAATNRDVRALVEEGTFRSDLYFRLHCLSPHIPPLRHREHDWERVVDYRLDELGLAESCRKSLSPDAFTVLAHYHWPGNVREVKAIVDTAFFMSDREVIEPRDFIESLEDAARSRQFGKITFTDRVTQTCDRLARGETSFWDAVYTPYMARELSRAEVKEIVVRGLTGSRGSYKKLLTMFSVADQDYLRFMDFLRHHRLKPDRN